MQHQHTADQGAGAYPEDNREPLRPCKITDRSDKTETEDGQEGTSVKCKNKEATGSAQMEGALKTNLRVNQRPQPDCAGLEHPLYRPLHYGNF